MASKIKTGRSVQRILALLCVLALFAVLTPPAIKVYRFVEYHSYTGRIESVIEQLAVRRPEEVDKEVWNEACGWLQTANGNICFSPSHVPLEDVRQLCDAFESRPIDAPNLATVEWMWNQFAAASPHGAQYAKRYRARYLEYVEEYHPELLTDEMRERLRVWREGLQLSES